MHRSLILYIPTYPLSYQVDGPVQVRGAPAGQQRGRRLHPPRLGHRHLRPRVGHGQLGHRGMRHLQNYELFCTGWMEWMSHRKWRETKQQPIMLPGPAVPGCCLVSFCFLVDIHSILSVYQIDILQAYFLVVLGSSKWTQHFGLSYSSFLEQRGLPYLIWKRRFRTFIWPQLPCLGPIALQNLGALIDCTQVTLKNNLIQKL